MKRFLVEIEDDTWATIISKEKWHSRSDENIARFYDNELFKHYLARRCRAGFPEESEDEIHDITITDLTGERQ